MLFAALAGLAGTPFVSILAAEPAKPAPRRDRAYGQMIIPLVHRDPQTPPTRTLTEAEARTAVERDWLFQAMDEPLLQRAGQEIGWASELADRLASNPATGDLTAERRELDELAARLNKVSGDVAGSAAPAASGAVAGAAVPDKPSWIWFPEGDSTRDASIEARYFRLTFTLPAGEVVQKASLLVTADDQCESFLNGQRLGQVEDWRRVAEYSIEKMLMPGRNVLAIRAENRAAPVTSNPAGLIASVQVQLKSGQRLRFVSDGAWRASRTPQPGWETSGFDDTAWPPARVSAAYGGGPWGKGVNWSSSSDDPGMWADPAEKELYLAVRRVKRRIVMKNPVLNFSQLLFIDQPTPAGPVNPEHEAIHRMGITAVPGGRLLVLDGLHPGGVVRQLAPERPGSFWRPDLSFDARRVLFCYKPHDEKSFHLYEINLDGSGLRQLTDSDYDDIDPIYVPDGHIVFTTTRGNSHVRCGPFIYSYILARCDADGGNIYLISQNGEPDFVPSLMEDGRVIYSRWEYTDKALWRVQSMWTVNPDGTHVSVFWGNQSVWPDHVAQPQQIPGTQKVMFCGVGHHDWWSGSIGILDRSKGMNFPHGLTKVTREQPWPEVGNGPVDPGHSERYHAAGRFTGYNTPYPLSEHDFLVSARGLNNRFRLYLMDVDGNRELIYEGAHNILHAIPIRPRPVPAVRADTVAWPGTGPDRQPPQPGIFFSGDVYEGVPDLPRGSVKYVRVFQQDHKTYTTWEKTYRHSGPAVSIIQEEAVKRILGTAPVEVDGSVHFRAPPGLTLYFQLLDEDYRCLQTMRSFSGLMPGEVRGCVGCHELHSTAPPLRHGLALLRPPSDLTPPPWGEESIGYERFVQGVLDRYCIRCHQGSGEASHKPDLTLRPGHGPFQEPYLTLVGAAGWGSPVQPGPGYGIAAAIPVEQIGMNNPLSLVTIRPLQYLSPASRLIDIASGREKHYDSQVDPVSLQRLIAWVDACSPYCGEEEIRAQDDPDFPGIELLPIRPRVKTAPKIERP